ncbi:hypothetical protein ACHAXS_009251 [Conticribra weissflogii]
MVLLAPPSCVVESFSIPSRTIGSIVSSSHRCISATATISAATSLTAKNGGGDDDGGWYDDYDDFVQKLDFDDGGWDGGADAPFDGPRGGRGRGGRGGRFEGRGGRGGGRRSRSSSSSSSSSFEPTNRFGNDYTRHPDDTSPVDESTVNSLLTRRLQFRKRGQFDDADGVRDELREVHGVTVWDREKVWTTDGGGGGGGGGRFDRERGGRGGRGRDRDRGRGPGRGRGRGRGSPSRERRFNEHGHDYTQIGNPVIDPAVCSLAEDEIHALIRTRMECKFDRNFREADRIEEELMRSGVNVHDGFKEWRADGEGWSRGGTRDRGDRGGPRLAKEYVRRGPGNGLTPEEIDEIDNLVKERSEAKLNGDYARADEIFEELSDTYDVNVDDKKGEWALLYEEYLLAPDTAFVPEEKVQIMIGKKLGERILARKSRDFGLADEIRDELLEEFLVEVDDRTKEWRILQPEGGRWADDEQDGDINLMTKEEWDDNDDDDDNDDYNDDDDDDGDDDMSFDENEDEDEDEDDEEHSDGIEKTDLSSLTVPELKEKLREAGLPVSGKKAELIERLELNSA